jgi:hypothetical protein
MFEVGETVRTKKGVLCYLEHTSIEDAGRKVQYVFIGDVVERPQEGTFDSFEVFVRCDYTDYRPDYSIGEVLGFYENELEYIG